MASQRGYFKNTNAIYLLIQMRGLENDTQLKTTQSVASFSFVKYDFILRKYTYVASIPIYFLHGQIQKS